jgi:hypothetical protein
MRKIMAQTNVISVAIHATSLASTGPTIVAVLTATHRKFAMTTVKAVAPGLTIVSIAATVCRRSIVTANMLSTTGAIIT